jgi:hypothetical protein
MIVDAEFVSVWDGGIVVRTRCKFDTVSGVVSDIEGSDIDGLGSLNEERVEWGDQMRFVEVDPSGTYRAVTE